MGSFPEKQNDPKKSTPTLSFIFSLLRLLTNCKIHKTRSKVVMSYLILADLSYGEVNSFRMSKEDGGHRSGRVHVERFC